MGPLDYLQAARCPESLRPQTFGLWEITRQRAPDRVTKALIGWDSQTVLSRWTDATLHQAIGEVVMEDSRRELSRHLPIWLEAEGRVLVTGLGLGCVVRGLLAKPEVEHVTVIEVDQGIIDAVWPEFQANHRCLILHGDALKLELPPGMSFDYAWHDIWCEERGEGKSELQLLHAKLIHRFHHLVPRQGAWQFPRFAKRLFSNAYNIG